MGQLCIEVWSANIINFITFRPATLCLYYAIYSIDPIKSVHIGSVIYHPVWIFEEILNLIPKIWNSLSSTCYSDFCCSATVQKIWPSPNVDDLYIILIRFWRRFQIWSPKFEIYSVAPTIAILIVQPQCGKREPHQMWMIYMSVWSNFQGDSESDHQNLKFTL